MDQAAAANASWLWWSWTDANTVEAPSDGATCQAQVTTSTSGFAGAINSSCARRAALRACQHQCPGPDVEEGVSRTGDEHHRDGRAAAGEQCDRREDEAGQGRASPQAEPIREPPEGRLPGKGEQVVAENEGECARNQRIAGRRGPQHRGHADRIDDQVGCPKPGRALHRDSVDRLCAGVSSKLRSKSTPMPRASAIALECQMSHGDSLYGCDFFSVEALGLGGTNWERGKSIRRSRLGGMLNFYVREAARAATMNSRTVQVLGPATWAFFADLSRHSWSTSCMSSS